MPIKLLPRVIPVTTLEITIESEVAYMEDVAPSAFATQSGTTPATPPLNFPLVTIIGDITKVNGDPVEGLYVGRTAAIRAYSTPPPSGPDGWAAAYFPRTALREEIFEIRQVGEHFASGPQIGTIMTLGFAGGDTPPGIPSATTGLLSKQSGNWAIVGGTGAFLGARGQAAGTGSLGRMASMAESPTNRRQNSGTDSKGNEIDEQDTHFLHIIPMVVPEIVLVNNKQSSVKLNRGVTASLLAAGIGPANSIVQPTQLGQGNLPVNSPIAITLNNQSAAVESAVSSGEYVGYYLVTFTVPESAALGATSLYLTAAWIKSASFDVTVTN